LDASHLRASILRVKAMAEANWHTYQVLTKRAERLSQLLSTRLRFAADCRHIWWGVSVEDKKYGLPSSRSGSWGKGKR
jgi:protein gp37